MRGLRKRHGRSMNVTRGISLDEALVASWAKDAIRDYRNARRELGRATAAVVEAERYASERAKEEAKS